MQELRRDPLARLLAAGVAVLLGAVLVPRVWGGPAPVAVVQPRITVSIEGEVARPGAYEVEFGARVDDLVELAGGFRAGAARTLVALAAPLTDGQVVQVPAVAATGVPSRVSLNSATLAELETLPGVGPATAGLIIDNRPYSRVDDLLRVPGIGPKKLERLRTLVAP